MHQVLSPKQLAQAIGVSESSLKRWADDGLIRVTRTAGGHRRIPLAEAIRFVRESSVTVVDPDVLGLGELRSIEDEDALDPRSSRHEVDRLTHYLEQGNAPAARGLIVKLFLDGRPVHDLCDDVVKVAMTRVDDEAHEGDEAIFVEHRATEIVAQALHHLQGVIDVREEAQAAVGAAPSGDPYQLPTLAAAVSLRGAGLRTVNLGADTPLEAVRHACGRTHAKLAWLAVTAPPADRARFVDDVLGLAEGLANRSASLVVGGRAAAALSLPDRRNLHVGSSMAELVAFARGLGFGSQD